jgi:hypothetical protein
MDTARPGRAGEVRGAMTDPIREYEDARFPLDRRLDVHGEGPRVARERALQWIQSRAHEHPGQELLIIVDRGRAASRRPSPVAATVSELLDELTGKLIARWRPFAPGSVVVRIAEDPRMVRRPATDRPSPLNDGRTDATAGAARPSPSIDIPPDLRAAANEAARLRMDREGLTTRVEEVVLREIWNEAQVRAFEGETSFADALASLLDEERNLANRLDD